MTAILSGTIDTLDAHVTVSAGSAVSTNVQEALVARDAKTMQPTTPALATSWETSDATTWIFHLRPGVKFHNGEAWDASAAKFNFDRVAAPDLKSTIGQTLAGIVASVDVVDPTTLRVTTKQPTAYFLERIVRLDFLPPQETMTKGNDYVATHPVGTGPYKFVEWLNGQHVTLTRNENYWGTKPAFRDIQLRELTETATAMAELLAGSVDIVPMIPSDQVDLVNKSATARTATVETQNIVEVVLDALARSGPNPFTDKRVRQAANYAVDRDAIAHNLMGGLSRPVAGWIDPLIFGYDPSLKPIPYDPSKAVQLLSEAGYAAGFDVPIKVYPFGSFVDSKVLAQALQPYLQAVGIRTTIQEVSSAQIGPLIQSGKAGPMWIHANQAAGAFDAALDFSYLDAMSVFSYAGDDTIAQMRAQAASTNDQDARKRTYAQLQQYVQDYAPFIFGWTGFATYGISKKVDYTPQADNGNQLFLARPV